MDGKTMTFDLENAQDQATRAFKEYLIVKASIREMGYDYQPFYDDINKILIFTGSKLVKRG